jgi:hypothetical protein
MTIKLNAPVSTEESTYIITVRFFDSDGNPVAPRLASWTLKDEAGAVVNSREAVDIPSPATVNYIALTGDDLALPDTTKPYRYLLVEALYDSVLYGNDLNLREEAKFKISNLVSIE